MGRLVELKKFNNEPFTVNSDIIALIRPATQAEVRKAFDDISASDGFTAGMENSYTVIQLQNNLGFYLTQGQYREVRGNFFCTDEDILAIVSEQTRKQSDSE